MNGMCRSPTIPTSWEVLVKHCPTEEDREQFSYRFDTVYQPLALGASMTVICVPGRPCRIFMRTVRLAAGAAGGNRRVCIMWRKLASRHNRVASPPRALRVVTRRRYSFEERI